MELPKASEFVGGVAGFWYVWSNSPFAACAAWEARTSTITIGSATSDAQLAPNTSLGRLSEGRPRIR